MIQQPASESKKAFFKNDRKLVCGMLVFYGLCILGLIVATFWWLDQRQRTISANATSTAFAFATQQANITATAIARLAEQDQYELIDRFDTNKNNWRRGPEDNEYWSGNITIQSGVYHWNIKETKATFVSWSDFSISDRIRDFDVYVDTKVVKGAPGDVCGGLLFRISSDGWDQGGYYFALCNNSLAVISYHTEKDGWERIVSLPYYRNSNNWNRLEITARGAHFAFLINSELIYEMDDDRQEAGGIALVVELNEKVSAEVMFDNFGFQSH